MTHTRLFPHPLDENFVKVQYIIKGQSRLGNKEVTSYPTALSYEQEGRILRHFDFVFVFWESLVLTQNDNFKQDTFISTNETMILVCTLYLYTFNIFRVSERYSKFIITF